MERTKKVVPIKAEDVEVEVTVKKVFLWRKHGGGSLRLNNKIIKPGETFYASEDEIPKNFLSLLECLEMSEKKTYEEKKKQDIKKLSTPYFLEALEDDLWNVINAEGKAINEKPLSKTSAEELQSLLEE